MTTSEQQLIDLARKQYLGVFFDSKAKREGRAFIYFVKQGSYLAVFHDIEQALAWLPQGTK